MTDTQPPSTHHRPPAGGGQSTPHCPPPGDGTTTHHRPPPGHGPSTGGRPPRRSAPRAGAAYPAPAPNSGPVPEPDSAPVPGPDSAPVPGPDSAPVPGPDSAPVPGPDSAPVPDHSVPDHSTPDRSGPGELCAPPGRPAGGEPGTAPGRPTSGTPYACAVPGPLTVTICRDPDQFGALADAWDGLYRRCGPATPFQSHAWLYSWWLSYGKRNRLRLVLVHREPTAPAGPEGAVPTRPGAAAPGGDTVAPATATASMPGTPAGPTGTGPRQLVAAAPLMLDYRPLPTLVPLGLDITDFCDVLLDDDCPQAIDALVTGLRRLAGTALVELCEVRPGAAAECVVERWRGPVHRRADSTCLELPGVPMDDLLRRLSGASARNARRKLRRVDELGVTHRAVPEHEVPRAVATMLTLHAQQWRGRGATPEHLRPRFAAHLTRATRQLVRTGDAALTEYRLGGEVLVSEVTLLSEQLAGGYLYGARPDARTKVDIATMLLRQDAARATLTGRRVLSLLRGDEPYKRHWRPETVVNQRLLLARRHLAPAWGLRVGYLAARTALAATARTRLPVVLAWRSRLRERWRGAARN